MNNFFERMEQNLAEFSPYEREQAVIYSPFFTNNEGTVASFLSEIRQTAQHLSTQLEVEYAEIYAKRLIEQIDALQKAVKTIKKKSTHEVFYSSYHFPKNVHNLPPRVRLNEYYKALRALNEKISWLLEKQYNASDELAQLHYQQQVQETEYRKMKCLKAIEELEEKE